MLLLYRHHKLPKKSSEFITKRTVYYLRRVVNKRFIFIGLKKTYSKINFKRAKSELVLFIATPNFTKE